MLGILGLLSLYIFLFLKTAADIEDYKRHLAAWNSRIIRTLTFTKVEAPADWQNVGIENSTFAVYSAFSFQESLPLLNQVVILGSHPHFLNEQILKCRFYYQTGDYQNKIILVEAEYEGIPGWMTGNGGLVIIKCSFPTTTGNAANESSTFSYQNTSSSPISKPTFVSILSGNRTEHGNRLPIQYKTYIGDIERDKKYDFSVCVPPLRYSYKHLFQFLEWLEYYKMMGVKQVSFYNLTLESNNSCVMEHLLDPGHGHSNENGVKEGGFQVHNYHWHFPTAAATGANDTKTDFGLGESSALMDCLLRHKGSSKYVGIINLDEFITPALDTISNFQQLINSVVDSTEELRTSFADFWLHKRYVGGSRDRISVEDIATRCALLQSNPLEHRVCQNLLFIQTSTWRDEDEEDEFAGGSAKYFMIPERVRIARVYHRFNLLESGYKTKRIPQTIAYIRVYGEKRIKQRSRRGKKVSQTLASSNQVNLKAALVLAKNVATSLQFLMKKCGLKEEDILKPVN